MIIKTAELIKNEVRMCKTIVLVGHIAPDADAIGSVMAMGFALEKMGHKVITILENIERKYDIIPVCGEMYQGNYEDLKADLFISLDCGDMGRLGKYRVVFENAKCTINIDHHESNNDFADYNCVEKKASSTCEVVFKVIRELVELDKDIMTCIYAGIVYDTGGFRHKSTSAMTHEVAMVAHQHGIDFNKVYNKILVYHSVEESSAFRIIIDRMRLDYDNKIVYSYILKEEMDAIGADKSDLDNINSYLIATYKIKTSFFIYEIEEGHYKVSLRTRANDVDVNAVANVFGGGGHKNASGFAFKGELQTIIDKVMTELIEQRNNGCNGK